MTVNRYTYKYPDLLKDEPNIIYTSTTTAGKQPTPNINIKPVLDEQDYTWSVGDIKDILDRVKETSELERLDSVIGKLKRKLKKCI